MRMEYRSALQMPRPTACTIIRAACRGCPVSGLRARFRAAHGVLILVWYDFGFMAEFSIGVDLGGTNLRAAAVTREGVIAEKISGRTELRQGREAVIADMVESINALK